MAVPLILNEYNAVSARNYLGGANYTDRPDAGDSYFAAISGISNGRIQGNGGNWIELVVTEDHADIRGWKLRWAQQSTNTGLYNIWTGNPTVEQGIITFGNANLWSDLRSGTIITISEQQAIQVDTTTNSLGQRNLTYPLATDGIYEAVIDLSTNTSYDPAEGDWWIHVSTLDQRNAPGPLLRTVTNLPNGDPGEFTVGKDNWQLTIVDAADAVVFGPVGEGISAYALNNEEIGRLEVHPSPTITPISPYNDGNSSTFGAPNRWANGLAEQDFSALRSVVSVQPQLQPGDADQDRDFDQLDLVMVQIAARYLTGQAATWGDGDWNGGPGGAVGSPPAGDGLFNQFDIIAAQQANLYLQGPYAAIPGSGRLSDQSVHESAFVPVPEPSTVVLLVSALAGLLAVLRVGGRYRAH